MTPREKEEMFWAIVSWAALIVCAIGMVVLA